MEFSDKKSDGYTGALCAVTDALKKFFMGKLYPPFVALLVLTGHVTSLEYYTNILNVILLTVALVLCESIKPFVIVLTTFVFQVTKAHTPGYPSWSSYYFEHWRLVLVFILGAFLLAALIYRFYKILNGRLTARSPMFIPLAVLSGAFLLGGAFCADYNIASLVYAIVQVAVYFLLFYVFYYGFLDEDFDSLTSYLGYVSLWIALVLIGEMAFIYLTYDDLYMDGAIFKDSINLGWGVSNPIGMSLTVLVPLLVYASKHMRGGWVYFLVACCAYISSIMTLSRNTWIFGTLTFIVSLCLGCFVGKRKIFYRIALPLVICAAGFVAYLYREQILSLFSMLINQGFSDSGRFELWRVGFENFLKYPVFGKGFFSFAEINLDDTANFLPHMAHNTVIQLLSALGGVGLIAYGYYRVRSVLPLLKKPCSATAYIYISIFAITAMSLLDNYVFYIYPMFYYSVILAVAHRGAFFREGLTLKK